MKKRFCFLAMLLAASFAVAACTPVVEKESAQEESSTEQTEATENAANDSSDAEEAQSSEAAKTDVPEVPKVCLLITGTLGDRAFFDSANAGLERLQADLGDQIETKVVEVGVDQTKYEPALNQVSNEDYDVIVVMGWIVVEHLQTIAPQHPEKTYIILDSSVDYSAGDCDNVYSVEYKSNEAAFLAGALASKMTSSETEGYNDKKLVGLVGAMDIPVINDFVVGYIEGAQFVDPETKSHVAYIGNFDDSAKAKELALNQYADGADIVFSVSAAPSIGVVDAASEKGQKLIGVDSDQAMLLEESAPEKAKNILTSVLKNTGNSLYDSVMLFREGKLPTGQAVMHGLAEGGVELAKNKYYEELVSQDVRDFVEDLQQKVISGEISVKSAYGLNQQELDEIRNSVKP